MENLLKFLPVKNLKRLVLPTKSKIEFRFKFIKGPIIKTTKEKNKLKNNGIKTNAKRNKNFKIIIKS